MRCERLVSSSYIAPTQRITSRHEGLPRNNRRPHLSAVRFLKSGFRETSSEPGKTAIVACPSSPRKPDRQKLSGPRVSCFAPRPLRPTLQPHEAIHITRGRNIRRWFFLCKTFRDERMHRLTLRLCSDETEPAIACATSLDSESPQAPCDEPRRDPRAINGYEDVCQRRLA
jgi:hypothetical protein